MLIMALSSLTLSSWEDRSFRNAVREAKLVYLENLIGGLGSILAFYWFLTIFFNRCLAFNEIRLGEVHRMRSD